MEKKLVGIGALSGFVAVALGAFGAHSLKDKLDPAQLAVFETAVRYQFYHALAILLTALLSDKMKAGKAFLCGNLVFAGILLFSGTLYVMTASYLFADIPWKWLGAITPLGGLLFMAGWFSLFLFTYQNKNTSS